MKKPIRPSEAEITYLREEIVDIVLASERLRMFGLSWDSSCNSFVDVHFSERERFAQFTMEEASRKAKWLITIMSLPAAPQADSLNEQAKHLESQVKILEDRIAKMRTLAANLRECAKKA